MDTLSWHSGETGSLAMNKTEKSMYAYCYNIIMLKYIQSEIFLIVCMHKNMMQIIYKFVHNIIIANTVIAIIIIYTFYLSITISYMQTDTARVIFSWNDADPGNNDPTQVMYHMSNRGVMSINLLGGQQDVPADPSDVQTFNVTVNAVRELYCLLYNYKLYTNGFESLKKNMHNYRMIFSLDIYRLYIVIVSESVFLYTVNYSVAKQLLVITSRSSTCICNIISHCLQRQLSWYILLGCECCLYMYSWIIDTN